MCRCWWRFSLHGLLHCSPFHPRFSNADSSTSWSLISSLSLSSSASHFHLSCHCFWLANARSLSSILASESSGTDSVTTSFLKWRDNSTTLGIRQGSWMVALPLIHAYCIVLPGPPLSRMKTPKVHTKGFWHIVPTLVPMPGKSQVALHPTKNDLNVESHSGDYTAYKQLRCKVSTSCDELIEKPAMALLHCVHAFVHVSKACITVARDWTCS